MLNHTKKIKEIYENIQKKLFYMIPEKWEALYLYSSVIEKSEKEKGELFFYYVPKGIFRKNPVNVYEIPAKFNLEEGEYLKLVETLYAKIKDLRKEFQKEESRTWTNLTIIIKNLNFKVEYDYEDLNNSIFSSYERHVIWRYKYLKIGPEQLNKEEKEILKKYMAGVKTLSRKENYEEGIYITDITNIVDFNTESYESTQNVEYMPTKNNKILKNQILLAEDDIKKR